VPEKCRRPGDAVERLAPVGVVGQASRERLERLLAAARFKQRLSEEQTVLATRQAERFDLLQRLKGRFRSLRLERLLGLEPPAVSGVLALPRLPLERVERFELAQHRGAFVPASLAQQALREGVVRLRVTGSQADDLSKESFGVQGPALAQVEPTEGVQRVDALGTRRDQLLDLAFGRAEQPFDRSIDIQVSRLRRKIEDDPKNPDFIKTVRGGGYTFAVAVDVERT